MNDVCADICVVLQGVKYVPLGASLEPAANEIIGIVTEALRDGRDGDEFVFSALLQQVATLLSSGEAESMLLWWKDGRFHCTFNTGDFDRRSQHHLIEAAIAGAVIEAEGVALEWRAEQAAKEAQSHE